MSFTSEARWSDVYLSAIARGTSVAGDLLAATALVLALQARPGGGYAVAALFIASTLPLTVLAPLAGRLADRVDSRVLLVAVGLAQAACCAALAYTGRPVVMIALVGVLAAGLAITQPTFAALLPEMVDRDTLPRAAAIGQTASAIGMLAGPALAGVLVGQFGLRLPLLLDAVTYLAIAAAGLLLRTRRNPGLTREAQPDARAATWRLRQDVLLSSLVVMTAAVVAAVGLVNVVEVFFLRDTLHVSTTGYGLIVAVWTATTIVGAWVVSRRAGDDTALARTFVTTLAVTTLMITLAGRAPAVGWLVALWAIGGLSNGALNTVVGVLIARRAAPAVRGRVYATLGGAVNGANLVGYLLGGLLVEVLSPGTLLTGSGLVGLAVIAVLAVPVLRVARREREAPHTVPAGPDRPQPVVVP
jgi:MFS family permease